MSFGKINQTNLDFEEIPEIVKVTGVSWDNRQELIPNLIINEEVKLIRDFNNQYDKYAIAVKTIAGNQIGWIPKNLAKILAPEIDAGIEWQATIEDILQNDQQLKGVSIKLFLL